MGSTTSKPTYYLPAFVKTEIPSLQSKTVVITGCTSGTGLVAAKASVKKGVANLLLLNRPSERATKAEQIIKAEIGEGQQQTINVETIPCDLQDFESVRSAANTIKEKYDSIDVLCNNAGIMAVKDSPTKDGYDTQMQTNHLSHFLLTKELFPLLKKAADLKGEARIVNHSSLAREGKPLKEKYQGKNGGNLGGDGLAKWERYHQTKLANVVFSLALADRLKGTKIKSLCAAPGFSMTNLQVNSEGMNWFMWLIARFAAQSAEDGTMPLLTCMYGQQVKSGEFWEPTRMAKMNGPVGRVEQLSKVCTDKESRNLLWKASEEACGAFQIS